MEEFVYFLQVNDLERRPVKIGHTHRPVKVRFQELQRQMPFHDLKLLGYQAADKSQETFLKKVFADHMIQGPGRKGSEWFEPCEPLMDYIGRVARATEGASSKV